MKKSGIILCAFAALLIISGVVLCHIGKGKGDVFDNTVLTDGDYVKRIEITSALNYIAVNFSAADINVYGGAESDYIETVNIEDTHINTSKSSGITISDSSDYLSMAYDTVTNFSGLRNILFPGKSYSGAKTINIYLSGNYNITQLNLELDSGNISVTGLDSNTDYGIRVRGTGDINLDHVTTKSNIQLSAGEGNISLTHIGCLLLSGNIHTGNLHCHEENPGEHYYDLTCENGMVYLLDESQGGEYHVNNTPDTSKIEFSVKNGNIHLNKEETQTSE